ncbi:hypothetical protein R1sor_022834 [Riccia sorocarpa]|uniref:Fungal lipase-type domain-containing protein n=1 Tax=Riccia sorocarpa TaxID=122646 RepID=A0ABD3GL19_9MARC
MICKLSRTKGMIYEPTQEELLKDLEKRFGRVHPLMSYGFDSNEGGGQQAVFVARSHSGRVIVACRGTCGFRDVLQDLKYMQSRLSFAKGTAHWGFAQRAESVPIDFFLKLLDAGEEIIFTGHSMGGAVASLLTLRVLESESNRKGGMFEEQVRCITFGTPLFASTRLAEMINEKYEDIFIHIVSRRDVVPKILPWISTLQKLVYADEDHLEGLVVLKSALGFVPWLPIVPVLTFLESRIPVVLKFLFRCFMKLALPSGMLSSYAFAGHIVMLDTMAAVEVGADKKKGERNNSLILTSAQDLNAWHSQLSFAFGSGFDVTMIEEHMLDCYYDGIVSAFSQVRLTRELNPRGELDPSFTTTAAPDGRITVRMLQSEEGKSADCCAVEVKSSLLTSTTMTTTTALIRAKSLTPMSRTSSTGEGSFTCGHQNHQSRSPKRKLERSLTTGKRSSSCSREGSLWSLPEKQQWEIKQGGKRGRKCRACQCLSLYMNVKGSCKQVTKNFFHFGWILGNVGRVARHLKILDNLCAFTFFRLVLSNILG